MRRLATQGQGCLAGGRTHTWQPCICGQYLEVEEIVYIEILEMPGVWRAGKKVCSCGALDPPPNLRYQLNLPSDPERPLPSAFSDKSCLEPVQGHLGSPAYRSREVTL